MSTKKTSFCFCLLFILFFLFATRFLYSANKVRERTASSTLVNWTISPLMVKLLSGEFIGVVSDFVTLEVCSYLGTEVITLPTGGHKILNKKIDWEYVERMFRLSMELDPYFEQTYTVSQGNLPWDAGLVETQNELLDKANTARFWDWQPAHFKGFNTYYFLEDPLAAGKIFLDVAQRPSAPYFLAILGSRMMHNGANSKDAILLMESMLHGKTEDDEGYQQMADRMEALKGVRLIEVALDRFEKKDGRKPNNLEELIDAGFLKEQPFNPYQLDYCIDSVGKVYFDEPKCGFFHNQP